jgi:hypothetical protein
LAFDLLQANFELLDETKVASSSFYSLLKANPEFYFARLPANKTATLATRAASGQTVFVTTTAGPTLSRICL